MAVGRGSGLGCSGPDSGRQYAIGGSERPSSGILIQSQQQRRQSHSLPIWRRQARWLAWSSISTGGPGGGSGGPGAGGGGGGGSGSGPDDDDADHAPALRWQGWHDRVAADPQFQYKMVCEQVIGVTAMVVGDAMSRPNWGLDELDFVFATLVVGMVINFASVYLLAPTLSSAGSAAKLTPLKKVFGPYFLAKWGAPPGHMFQPGFGLAPRLVNYAYKGAVFTFIGLGAGVVGTLLSNGLLAARKRLDPAFQPPNEPPSVVGNAACWAAHMALSSNTRYQVLNGLDMVLQPMLPAPLFRVYAPIVRGANNLLGGMTFVLLAKVLGVQKAAEPAAAAATALTGKSRHA